MSDSLSPEEPMITDTGIVIDAYPSSTVIQDYSSPTPSKTPKSDEEKWNDYLENYDRLNKLKNKLNKKIEDIKKKFKKANPDASVFEKKKNLNKKKKQLELLKNEIDILEKSIDKPTIIDMPKQLDDIRKEINLQKRIITEYKLDLLFDLDDEQVILTEFQSNKENLEKLLEYASQLKELYDKKTKMIEIVEDNIDIAEKKSDDVKKTIVSRKDLLHKKQKQLNQLISNFKKNIKQYQQSGENSLLSDSLEIYKNVIMPLQTEIRNLKYQVIYIDKISQSNNGKINKKEMPIFHFTPRQVNLENEQYYDIN